MFKPISKIEQVNVRPHPEQRRRFSVEQKLAIVVRQHDVHANQVFRWRKLYQEGSLAAVRTGESVVPASELAEAMKQTRDLQRMRGKKTMENEILKEAVEIAHSRKWIARRPLLPGGD